MVRRPVQRVVKRLGYLKKILAAAHDLPFDLEVQLLGQGDKASETFRHAAANGCRIDHLDATPAQRFGQGAQFLDFTCAKQFGIVIQRNATEGQGLTHAFLLSRSISRSSLARALSNVFVQISMWFTLSANVRTPSPSASQCAKPLVC